MVQVINDPNRQSTGGAVGSALSSALQGLASHKIGQMQAQKQQERTAQGLQSIFNIPAQDAHKLARLEPAILDQVVKQKLAEPGQVAYQQGLQALLGGEQQNNMQQQPHIQSANHEQSIAPQPQQPKEAPDFHPDQVTQEQRDELVEFLRSPQAQSSLRPEELKMLSEFASSPFGPAIKKEPLLKGGLNEKQATELAKLGLQKQENAAKRDVAQIKATKEELGDFRKKHKVAKEDLQSLERLEELEKNNELDSETYNAFLEGMGLDLPALRSPGSQEFNKIVNNFIRNIKDIFGARISNQELEQFMLTLPNLSQSPEGRKRVIANLKKVARTNYEYGKAAQEILKDHKGIPPIDIADQVEERIDKRLDKVADQFKVDLKRPVPESANKLGVAASYGIGKAIPVTGGAVLGGIVGGPVGALLGGAIGGYGKSIFNVFSK